MGLGKVHITASLCLSNFVSQTLQTIAFSAYLREERFFRPFMIVCPLSVLHNWVAEYQKFAPNVGNDDRPACFSLTLTLDSCVHVSWYAQ